jgi:hypothetical protein
MRLRFGSLCRMSFATDMLAKAQEAYANALSGKMTQFDGRRRLAARTAAHRHPSPRLGTQPSDRAPASGRRSTPANIVGSRLRLSSKPKYRMLGWNKEAASEWANATEDRFSTWAETTECEPARTQTLLGLTLQINVDALALVMWLPRKPGRLG